MESIPTKISVSDVLVDVDGTLSASSDQFTPCLGDILIEERGLTRRESDQVIEEVKQRHPGWEGASYASPNEIFQIAHELGIAKEKLWDRGMRSLREYAVGFPDATRMVKDLHRRGFHLHIVSGNAGLTLLSKLALADLATREGSPYFEDFFNEEAIPYPKADPQYYREVLRYLKVEADDVVIIGDWEPIDLYSPLEAGLKNIILVRRGRPQKIFMRDCIYVNSLDLVPALLEKKQEQ